MPQCVKPKAFIRPFHTQESTYVNINNKNSLNSEPQVVDLVLSLFLLWGVMYSIISLPVFVCKMISICYYRKSYTKHYIVTFWVINKRKYIIVTMMRNKYIVLLKYVVKKNLITDCHLICYILYFSSWIKVILTQNDFDVWLYSLMESDL